MLVAADADANAITDFNGECAAVDLVDDCFGGDDGIGDANEKVFWRLKKTGEAQGDGAGVGVIKLTLVDDTDAADVAGGDGDDDELLKYDSLRKASSSAYILAPLFAMFVISSYVLNPVL